MKTIIITILSLVIVRSINPEDYVWIDYSITNPIILTQNNNYQTNIPCRVRIGTKCSYNYKLLPLDWTPLDDGTLVIPEKDANKDGNFLIQAQLSDMSGQKLNAKLILQITNKLLKVIDQSDYYKKIGFTPQQKSPSSTYQVSPIQKDIPDGFPSLKDIETIMNSGEPLRIKQTIQQITLNYGPCRSKINYLTLVKQLIKKLITNNQNKISQNTNQIQKLNKKLISLKIKKINQLEKSGITKDIQDINKKISKVNQQYANNKAIDTYYQGLANQTLERFMKSTGKAQGIDIQKNKKQLNKLKNRQITWNKWLIKAIKNRLVLQKGLYKIKLLKQSKGMQNNPINSYIIPAYQTNMNQLLQAESNKLQNQIKLIDLNQEFEQNIQLIKYMDLHLSQLHPAGFITNVNTNSDDNEQTVDKIKNQNIRISQQIQNIKLIIRQLRQCNNQIL